MSNSIIVIGAGIGGLSTAIRLAAAGNQVTIYEKNERVGGKMYIAEQDGFRWDTGPSVITMRHVFEDLFAVAGCKLDDYITFLPVDPLTRYFYPDGTQIDATNDVQAMTERIEQIAPGDGRGYQKYLKYAAKIHEVTGPVFIYDKPPSPESFAKVPPWQWLKADPMRTMSGAINSFVKSDKMRQLLGRFATYVGGSPYDAPATLNVIADVELSGGVWYPQGGIYAIAEGMARLAAELGVEINTNSPVKRIITEDRTVIGVELTNGTQCQAKAVIANADVTAVYAHLLPQEPAIQQRLKTLQGFPPSCSGFVLLLGVDKQFPELAHHNIFFSRDYPAEFDAIFQHGMPPKDPTIYISITSKTDADHAPNGAENWFVLVNAPPVNGRFDWEQHADAYRDRILNKLTKYGIDVRDHIISEQRITPGNLERMSGAWRGALYGQSPNSRWTAFRRPHNRCPDVQGLYFAGGTTHPGGGVPMVTLSGKVAAELVLEDLQ
jgi:phytoene desaturase